MLFLHPKAQLEASVIDKQSSPTWFGVLETSEGPESWKESPAWIVGEEGGAEKWNDPGSYPQDIQAKGLGTLS